MSSVLHFFSLLLLVGISLLSGVMKVADPAPQVQYLQSSGFPKLLKLAGLPALSTAEATQLIQVTGGLLALLSVAILFNVGRSFSAFLLGLMIVGITVSMHVNIEDPAKTSQNEQIHVLKNLSIVGGLWLVSLYSARRPTVTKAAAKVSPKAKIN